MVEIINLGGEKVPAGFSPDSRADEDRERLNEETKAIQRKELIRRLSGLDKNKLLEAIEALPSDMLKDLEKIIDEQQDEKNREEGRAKAFFGENVLEVPRDLDGIGPLNDR